MLNDFRHAIRLFAKTPAFSAAIVCTLALGIGANTAIFSLVQAVLLRPLPYHDPDNLVFVWEDDPGEPRPHARHQIVTGDQVPNWSRVPAFESFAAMSSSDANPDAAMDLAGPDGAERLRGAFVTPNFFELLGVRAALGRTFDSSATDADTTLVVISDALWRRRFGADAAIIGRSIDLWSRRPRVQTRHTIVGVLPPGFRFSYPRETEVWALRPWTRLPSTGGPEYYMLARLRQGASAAEAQAQLTAITSQARRAASSQPRRAVGFVESLSNHLAADVQHGMFLLLSGAGVVMLIACVNVALLLLALIADRRREIAVRTAIGGTPMRIARQLFAESSVLVVAGSVLGVLLAAWLMPALRALVPATVPRADEIVLDRWTLLFAIGVSVITALACGLAPVWHASHKDAHAGLRQSSASTTATRELTRWRRAIVVIQVSVLFALVTAATLLLYSFWRIQHVDLGFDGRGVITMEMRLYNPKYYREPGRLAAFQQQLMERVRALPGVSEASMTTAVPFRGVDFFQVITAVGAPTRGSGHRRYVDYAYFSLMRIPLKAGRLFTAQDDAAAPKVAIVSESFSRQLFGDQSPIGRHLDLDRGDAEIVGVVGEVRHVDVTRTAAPAFYTVRAQYPAELMCLVVRTDGAPTDVGAAIRSIVQSLDPDQPVHQLTTLDRLVREASAEERFYAVSTGGFALVALLLAVAGLAGVVSRGVTERVREIAIRTALGAEPGRLLRLLVRSGMVPVVAGLAIGSVAAWVTSRLLAGFLFEVSPANPLVYVATACILAGASLAACYVPARRATQVNPMAALKVE